jgi:hypothetical protein
MSGSTSSDKAVQQLVNAQSTILLSTCIDEDREQLRQHYAYLAFVFVAGKGNEVTWFANADECKWQGVECEGARISRIILPKKGLTGTIPVDVGLWYNLTVFHVFKNNLRGSLPSSIGAWTGLTQLSLWDNQFTGTVSTNVASWTAIQVAYFYFNSFNGTMPQIGNTFCPRYTSVGSLLSDCCDDIACKCCNCCVVGNECC